MRWNFQQRIAFTTLVPLAIVILALSYIHIDQHKQNLNDSLNFLGETIAIQIATSSAHGLASNRPDSIKPLIEHALLVPEVISVTIVNQVGNVVLRSIDKDSHPQVNSETPTITASLIFMRPIKRIATAVNASKKDLSTNPTKTEQTPIVEPLPDLGWTIVELSPHINQERQIALVKNGFIIALISFASGSFLILLLTGRITKPIKKLSIAANEIEQGNYDIQLSTGSSGEFATLESSIKKMANSLKQSRDKLDSKINQATLELLRSVQITERQNMELKSARKQALLASKVKSEFLANMSHEIRTPMNGVLGFLKLLRKTQTTSEQLSHIDTIEKSANNLLHIINDILDISKIEAGKVKINSVRYGIRECIETVISLLAPSAYDKQIELVYFIYNDVPATLLGDEAKLRQILTNLIGNALKFTDHGEIVIRVMVEDIVEQSAIIKVSVTDTGIGIEEKDLHRLFFTFEQADSSSTRKFSGTGLGLTISKTLTELMGGKIEVDSKPGQGSTFAFTFKHKIPATKKQSSVNENDSKLKIISGISVLLYDSNQASQMAVNHLLNHINLKTVLVNQREKLLSTAEQMQSNNQHLYIFMCLSQHDVTSKTLPEQIEKLKSYKNIKLVGLLNSADPAALQKVKSYGFDICLSKPLRYQDAIDCAHSLVINKLELAPTSITNEPIAVAVAVSPISSKQETVLKGPLHGLRILVAEDNAINAKLVGILLSQAGAIIHSVSDGQAAVDATNEQKFDIILMDVHMPRLNGIKASTAIRKYTDYRKSIPIIALTADAMPEDNKTFQNAGMNALMIKPLDEKQLISAIIQLTDIRNQERQNNVSNHTSTPSLTTVITTEVTHEYPRSVERVGQSFSKIKPKVDKHLDQELFGMLLVELPDFKYHIVRSFEDKNLEALEEHSHKLHGAVCYCDVPKLKSAVQILERAAKNKETNSIEEKVFAVKSEIDLILQSTHYG